MSETVSDDITNLITEEEEEIYQKILKKRFGNLIRK